MDTPMHAAAIPDADRASLKRPETAAREFIATMVELLPQRIPSVAVSRRAS
jgi:hypothetical protein